MYFSFLHKNHPHIFTLDTTFHRVFRLPGWDTALRQFFLHQHSSWWAKSTQFKPTIDAHSILIPIHIQGYHWIALARRVINNHTFFLYSDDLNSSHTFETIKKSYNSTSTSTEFHPDNSTWINCKSYTYHPHSNECGPRAILALTIRLFTQIHRQTSYYHCNITQITWWWTAKSIISKLVSISPLEYFSHHRALSCHIHCKKTWTRLTLHLCPFNIDIATMNPLI